jgi:hypothetical protein
VRIRTGFWVSANGEVGNGENGQLKDAHGKFWHGGLRNGHSEVKERQ